MPERVGVLGGTFDPIHNGHLALAQAAREQLGLDLVVYVPAGVPWRKAGREITAAAHRLEMVRLATANEPASDVSEVEIERDGPSYTADTLEALANKSPGAELYFIIGEDALEDLPNWREPQRILRLARLAVARRPGRAVPDDRWRAIPSISGRLVWLEMEPVAISASEIRRLIGLGKPVSGMLPADVEAYIRKHGLYSRHS
jgi:nicotinate-nucleotide adenylyltransferase